MRRLVVLFVLAVLGAGVVGLTGVSSGLSVNGSAVDARTMRAELASIADNPSIQCYLTAVTQASLGAGAGAATISAAGAAAWSSMRVEGLAIERYVTDRFGFRPDAKFLAEATSSLEGEMTQAATQHQYTCPGTSSQALASLPGEMRDALVRGQAASLVLASKLNATIPVTSASIEAFYAAHTSDYDTICVSVAVVSPSQVSAFEAGAQAGQSIAQLVKTYSLDAQSKLKDGALGCFSPGQTPYVTVRQDVAGTANGTFSTTPRPITLSGSTYALFVAPTSRTRTTLTKALSAVYSDIQAINASAESKAKNYILYRAAVAVDPAFGRWGLGASGPGIFSLATPARGDVTGASVLVSPNATPYQ